MEVSSCLWALVHTVHSTWVTFSSTWWKAISIFSFLFQSWTFIFAKKFSIKIQVFLFMFLYLHTCASDMCTCPSQGKPPPLFLQNKDSVIRDWSVWNLTHGRDICLPLGTSLTWVWGVHPGLFPAFFLTIVGSANK